MTIGDKIRIHRKSLNLTQTELGDKLGVKTNAVSKWECGRVEDIPMSKVKAMAILFDVPISYLIDEDSELRKPQKPSVELSGEEECLIFKFRALDARGKSAVLNVLNFEYDSLPGEKADSVAKEA